MISYHTRCCVRQLLQVTHCMPVMFCCSIHPSGFASCLILLILITLRLLNHHALLTCSSRVNGWFSSFAGKSHAQILALNCALLILLTRPILNCISSALDKTGLFPQRHESDMTTNGHVSCRAQSYRWLNRIDKWFVLLKSGPSSTPLPLQWPLGMLRHDHFDVTNPMSENPVSQICCFQTSYQQLPCRFICQ